MTDQDDPDKLKKEILQLHSRLAVECSTTEELRNELSRVREEMEQLQATYLNVVDSATAIENAMEAQLEKLTHHKPIQEELKEDPGTELRQKLMQEVLKNEELHEMNKRLLEQLEQFQTLYANTMAHSTAIENELDEKYREVSRLSITDALTGTLNRSGFYKNFDAEFNKSLRRNQSLSLIMFDVDRFKQINDNHGHDVGDQVLISLTEVIMTTIRKGDILCRWGGDEFFIILPEMDLTTATSLAERLRQSICTTSFRHVKEVSCSFGVVQVDTSESLETVIKRADFALYESKRKGRNSVSAE